MKLVYSARVRDEIRRLAPAIKSEIKAALEFLSSNAYAGKALQKELSGYFSYKVKRYRIIYKILAKEREIHVHHFGHRKDVYHVSNF